MNKKGATDFLSRFRRGSSSRRRTAAPKGKPLQVAVQNYLMEHHLDSETEPVQDEHVDAKVGILDELLQKIRLYLPDDDIATVIRAYHFADNAHYGQMRDSV